MTLFVAADTIGLVSFSLSGFLAGVRKDLDLLGIVISAFMTAIGGGILRDVMVGQTPFVFAHGEVLVAVMIGIFLAFLFKLHKKKQVERYSIFILSDSIGLIAFSVTGSLVGIENGFNLFGVMLLGFITAVGGGMLRDMMIKEIPIVLKSDFYGTVSLLVSALIYGCDKLGVLNSTTLIVIAILSLALRLIAYHKRWRLPKVKD